MHFKPETHTESSGPLGPSSDLFPKKTWDQFRAEVLDLIHESLQENCSDLLLKMGEDHFATYGKLLRPRLVYRLSAALGPPDQDHRDFLPRWAAAIEVLHNATLIHDDLQDGDQNRRGRATIWKAYGANQAINLGDLLILLAPQIFLKGKLPADRLRELSMLFSTMACKIVNGQSFEAQINSLRLTEDLESAYFRCISQKTSALFSALAEGVCIVHNLPRINRELIGDLFLQIGNLFQVQDDVLDLYGDKQRQQVACDLREGKVSFIVVKHWKDFPEDRDFLTGILHKPREQTTDQDVHACLDLLQRKGTPHRVQMSLKHFTSEVRNHLVIRQLPGLKHFTEETLAAVLAPIDGLERMHRGQST